MKQATIKRLPLDECNIGVIKFGDNLAFTLELPNLDNQKNISCIPTGNYVAAYRRSPSNGDVIQLQNVKDRSYIQIHAGNFTHQIAGCILVGDSIKDLNGDGIPDVTNSRPTLKRLLDWAGKESFILSIK